MAFEGAIKIVGTDNIAVCLEDVKAGASVEVRLGQERWDVTANQDVPFGFKIALTDISKGEQIRKYGESIGIASANIKLGDMVHVHNLEGSKGRGDLEGVAR